MDSAWKPTLRDVVACNSTEVEVVDLPDFEYEQLLVDDVEFDKWVKIVNWV